MANACRSCFDSRPSYAPVICKVPGREAFPEPPLSANASSLHIRIFPPWGMRAGAIDRAVSISARPTAGRKKPIERNSLILERE